MNAGTVSGRYKYTPFFKALRTAFFVGLFMTSASLILIGDVYAYTAILPLIAGLLLAPLIVKYFTYSMTIDETQVLVEYLGTRIQISLADIVSVRIKELNMEQSVYVRDRRGNKFSCEKGLNNYGEIRDFLVHVSNSNNYKENEIRVLGRHEYLRWYKVLCALALLLIWFLLAMAVPSSVLAGEIDLPNDLNALAISAILLVPAVILPFTLIQALTFHVAVDQNSIRSEEWLWAKKKVLLRNVADVGINKHDVFESMWIKDTLGNKVVIERFVEDYESLKRHLLHKYGSSE